MDRYAEWSAAYTQDSAEHVNAFRTNLVRGIATVGLALLLTAGTAKVLKAHVHHDSYPASESYMNQPFVGDRR